MPATFSLLGLATLLGVSSPCASATAQTTVRVSLDSQSLESNRSSGFPSLSADGRFVAFESAADNLVPGDTNQTKDIFVHDRAERHTRRVSVATSGLQANDRSEQAELSADGRFVAFMSTASNLVPGDTNGLSDVFLHDCQLNTTIRVSIGPLGSEADQGAKSPYISADGQLVCFSSSSTNLVLGDTNGLNDAFVHDVRSGITERISVSSSGAQAAGQSLAGSVAADGRFVTFASGASNLVMGDTNNSWDLFVHDRMLSTTERVSIDSFGSQANNMTSGGSMSADGRFVAFASLASNLVPGDINLAEDVFVHDRQTGSTRIVSVDSQGVQANDWSPYGPAISANGRFVAFGSAATNLVPGDSNGSYDIFVHDVLLGSTERVSVDSLGAQANFDSKRCSISADGRIVAFESAATNLVASDLNNQQDLFVRNRGLGSGSAQDTISLSGSVHVGILQTADFAWFSAPPGAHFWLLASWSRSGTIIGGHAFDVGPATGVLAHGFCTARGTGTFTTLPVPAHFLGRTFYVEVGARDAAGAIYDSNTLERIVQ